MRSNQKMYKMKEIDFHDAEPVISTLILPQLNKFKRFFPLNLPFFSQYLFAKKGILDKLKYYFFRAEFPASNIHLGTLISLE